MASTIKVGPLTRIEGHLDIEVSVEQVNGKPQVVAAKSSGTMFRGFERILQGRDPRDATRYTPRICGVCPIAHGMASSLVLENAFRITPPANGRILRNLILGSNFIASHVLHFYHLTALDYIDTSGILDMAPWTPRFVTPDMVTGAVAQRLVDSLRMGRMLKCAPREVVIIGIQPADVTPGLELSPQVAALVPGLTKLALEQIQKAGRQAAAH